MSFIHLRYIAKIHLNTKKVSFGQKRGEILAYLLSIFEVIMKRICTLLAVLTLSFSSLTATEKVINMFLIGPGLVGSELLRQIGESFTEDDRIEIRLVGLANTKMMAFDTEGLCPYQWKDELAESKEEMSIESFVQKMILLKLPNSVFVDCTSHPCVAEAYRGILSGGIAIVTPNKKANSASYSTYRELRRLSEKNHVKFLYDANVGAGLPFIQTIRTLNRSGDSIVKIEAVLSGTLSYLFNTFDGSVPFSKVLFDAQQKGYTEPDPRDDLNGMDMARKFLILAREAGLQLEMKDIVIQRFLPDECFDAGSVSEFYQELGKWDDEISALAKSAKLNGQVLRFIGTLEDGKAYLSLRAVGQDHPFYALSGADNIGAITSKNYSNSPIVIRGPGAGATVTAASVLGNIVQAGLDE